MNNREGLSEYIDQQNKEDYSYEVEDAYAKDSIAFNVAADIKGVENFVVDKFLKLFSEMWKKKSWPEEELKNELINTEDDIRENFEYMHEGYAPHQIRIYVTPGDEPEKYRVQFYDNLGNLNDLGGIDKFARELLQSQF